MGVALCPAILTMLPSLILPSFASSCPGESGGYSGNWVGTYKQGVHNAIGGHYIKAAAQERGEREASPLTSNSGAGASIRSELSYSLAHESGGGETSWVKDEEDVEGSSGASVIGGAAGVCHVARSRSLLGKSSLLGRLPEDELQPVGEMTLSNITSASAGETSVSSGNRTDGNTTLPPSSTPATPATTNTISSGQPPGVKRKRNLPGTPDPDAEVIALSPKTLMATNRFVCEICNKGFQRDQNLQLHRRGHNLPWKLRQRTSKEIRKRVYICPEPSCVHHDPSRALGDLTGIKKHFCRKHGEKKWKCDKCSKRYAVQSDWKAHSKTCGTREYRCDCGTLFSRRDSFITHRAFCDALAEESARVSAGKQGGGQPDSSMGAGPSMSVMGAPSSPRGNVGRMSVDSLASVGGGSIRPGFSSTIAGMGGLSEGGMSSLPPRWGQAPGVGPATQGGAGTKLSLWLGSGPGPGPPGTHHMQQMQPGSDVSSPFMMQPPKGMHGGGGGGGGVAGMLGPMDYDIPQAPRPSGGLLPMGQSGPGSLFANLFASGGSMSGMQGSSPGQSGASMGMGMSGFSDFTAGANRLERGGSGASGLSLTSSVGMTSSSSSANNNGVGSLPSVSSLFNQQQHTSTSQMSATALLQKAAQMGATASNSSLLRGFGMGGADSSSMQALWQGSRQEQGRAGGLPPSMAGLVHPHPHPMMRRQGDMQSPQQGMGSSLGPSSFGGQGGRPADHVGVQDFMNSLSGGAGIFGGAALSMFGSNPGGMGGGMMPPTNNHRHMSASDVLGHVQFQGGPVSQGMGPSMMPGLGGPSRGEDGSDRFTRDFLGVGGAGGMAGAAGGMGRTLSQRDLASLTSLGPGVDLGAFGNQRENLRSVGASGHSPGKSWDGS